jgi:hypothetical protein
MAASRPNTPTNEKELLFSKKKKDFIQVKEGESYVKSDILPITTFDEAEAKLKIWIENQFSNEEGDRSWVTKWGDKTASQLNNMGKVIGKNFFIVEKDFLVNGKPLASYRVDWDDIKGVHYNPVIRRDHKHEDAFFLKVHLQQLSAQSSSSLQNNGRLEVLKYFLSLTKEVLSKKEVIPDENANDLLKNYMKITDRSYFQNFGLMLRPVIGAALAAFEKYLSSQSSKDSGNVEIFDSSINQEKIIIQVTNDLHEIWKTPILLCLAEIRAGHEFTSDNSLPLDVAKVF